MTPHPILPLATGRRGDLAPLVAASILVAAMAMHATLLAPRPAVIEFPPGPDAAAAGALPEVSVAPEMLGPPPLPSEAVPPDDAGPAGAAPGVAITAPPIAAPFQGAGDNALPLPGAPAGVGSGVAAGNIHVRTTGTRAMSALTSSLMQQIQRLQRARPQIRPAEAKKQRQATAPSVAVRLAQTKTPGAPSLGGPARPTGVLGGPNPLAPVYAAAINGSTARKKF
jgi:hypothetical protein